MYVLMLSVHTPDGTLLYCGEQLSVYNTLEELDADVNNQLLITMRDIKVHGRLYVGKTVWRANELIDAATYFAEVPTDYGESQAVS